MRCQTQGKPRDRRVWGKKVKKFSKWVDVWRARALASRADPTKGGRETGCRSWCETPDRLFSLLEGSSLTVWPSTGRARSEVETPARWNVKRETRTRSMLGRGKRLNCALRAIEGAWSRPKEETREVGNPDLKSARQQCRNGESSHFYGEFDSGSERTLAACLRHASRTGLVE